MRVRVRVRVRVRGRIGLGSVKNRAKVRIKVRVRVRVDDDDLRAVLAEAEHDADRGDAPMTKPRLIEQGGFSCARGCPVRHLGSASLGPSASWAMLAPRPYGVCFSTG